MTGGLRTGEKGFLRSLRQRCELRRFLIVFPSIGLMLNEKPHYAQKRDKPLNGGCWSAYATAMHSRTAAFRATLK